MDKPKHTDTYYKLVLIPTHFHKEHDTEIYIKGVNLVALLADIGGAYKVKVAEINNDGFILRD